MCSRDKEFTIRGIEDCLARGYDRTGFFEVDTGEQRAWTVQLTERTAAHSACQDIPGNGRPGGALPGVPLAGHNRPRRARLPLAPQARTKQ